MNTNLPAPEAIRDLAARITTGWELCDSWLQNNEAELMICQTLCACVINLNKHGEAFSIRDPNVFTAGQCVNNRKAYDLLVSNGYFVEDTRTIDGKETTVIFVTHKLLDAVRGHFAQKLQKTNYKSTNLTQNQKVI